MEELELEKTYLARYLPEGLVDCEHKELVDIYIPESSDHPHLRIRQKGKKYEITKKVQLTVGDASQHTEMTIPLEEAEFKSLSVVTGKTVRKTRYFYQYGEHVAEIDVFADNLEGLVLVDFEFITVDAMRSFMLPDFCLVDVTNQEFIAGGMLCGKKYEDIRTQLEMLGYKQLAIKS